MADRNPEVIERCDKREAAIHEAGHFTVGLALGVHGDVWVYRSQTIDPENEKLSVGKHETNYPITAAIALSGLVAEGWVENSETSADEIADWIDDGLVSPSATDEAQFPPSYEGKLAAVVEALALLQKHKAFIDWAVEQLIDAEVVTDVVACEKFRQLYG